MPSPRLRARARRTDWPLSPEDELARGVDLDAYTDALARMRAGWAVRRVAQVRAGVIGAWGIESALVDLRAARRMEEEWSRHRSQPGDPG